MGVASYELFPGEAFLNTHPNYAHLKPEMLMHAERNLIIFEAPEPWGPFALVYFEEYWEGKSFNPYCPRVPLKWMSDDGISGWMQFSGSWSPTGRHLDQPALLRARQELINTRLIACQSPRYQVLALDSSSQPVSPPSNASHPPPEPAPYSPRERPMKIGQILRPMMEQRP